MHRRRRPDHGAVGGAEFQAERGQGSQPEIVRRASAHAEEDGGDVHFGRRPEELAAAVRRGLPGIAVLFRQQAESAGRRHLDDRHRFFRGRPAIDGFQPSTGGVGNPRAADQTQAGVDESAPRTGGLDGDATARHRLGENLGKTVSTVCERAEVELPVAMASLQRARREVARPHGRERTLELVKSNKDAHAVKLRVLGDAGKN